MFMKTKGLTYLLRYKISTAFRTYCSSLNPSTALAIVGSRNPTPQGAIHARDFAYGLAASGLTIVSGMALGVDGAAHEGALLGAGAGAAAGHLPTIAIVGTGLDRVYPRQHRDLAHRIAQKGLILSEYPLGTPPLAPNFPKRNRIISGLSQGTLVVEAALASGSLITARTAVEQGREVFAIPGSIHSPQSRGCHALIRQGAKLVESAQDVMEELHWPAASQPPTTAPSATPAMGDTMHHSLLEAMGFDPIGLDALQARSGLDTARLQVQLLENQCWQIQLRNTGQLKLGLSDQLSSTGSGLKNLQQRLLLLERAAVGLLLAQSPRRAWRKDLWV